ncbi:DNA cytosine methyltransferase [Winogradskyella aurantiaca]|uniref:DNA cytosine methyltransferase n=1 Tax=Winogradskyella aurantiaca TaxID=2219558 RepID=UPI000E1D1A83|nr:DNA cytosine methyltransferase [Winogradskyella aurantiaca]
MSQLTVIDFFCGAGGFSEGFRQMGFKIVNGYDYWRPAVETYNHNFGTSADVKNILDFENIEEIEQLPDTDIILGSPPCVSFSNSNNSGKADKSLGLRLTECFLRVVAVKKHQKGSMLKAWFMENVVNSKRYLKEVYTFKDLSLDQWAIKNNINPQKIAIRLLENTEVINSADYGSLQARKRVISGELISNGKLVKPPQTHTNKPNISLPKHRSIGEMKKAFPSPFKAKYDEIIKDPLFDITLNQTELTDHFYDTGIYAVDAKFSRHWKVNHPYMGKMSFPENEDKPSRTITATKISHSRESIIYRSEITREGDGEFRLPTVREAAIYMGFPITFQFKGSEYTKWRLVGNAVCSSVSKSFAKTVLQELSLPIPEKLNVEKRARIEGIENLNTFSVKTFDSPPVKNRGAKCRWHSFKDGNLTVTLSNFRIGIDKTSKNKWYTSIQYGNGEGYPSHMVSDNTFKKLEPIIKKQSKGNVFLEIVNNGFTEKIGSKKELQYLFENQTEIDGKKDPTELIEELKDIINSIDQSNSNIDEKVSVFRHKTKVPLKQVFALYGINKIVSLANNKKE